MRDPLYLSPWARSGLAHYGIDVPALRARLRAIKGGLAISGKSRQGPWVVSNGLHPLRETPGVADLREAVERAVGELEGIRNAG